jgi:hypothetical protein
MVQTPIRVQVDRHKDGHERGTSRFGGHWNPVFLNGNYLIGGVDRLGFNLHAQVFPCGSVEFGLINALLDGRPRGASEFNQLINGGLSYFGSVGISALQPPIGGEDQTGSMGMSALIPFT